MIHSPSGTRSVECAQESRTISADEKAKRKASNWTFTVCCILAAAQSPSSFHSLRTSSFSMMFACGSTERKIERCWQCESQFTIKNQPTLHSFFSPFPFTSFWASTLRNYSLSFRQREFLHTWWVQLREIEVGRMSQLNHWWINLFASWKLICIKLLMGYHQWTIWAREKAEKAHEW